MLDADVEDMIKQVVALQAGSSGSLSVLAAITLRNMQLLDEAAARSVIEAYTKMTCGLLSGRKFSRTLREAEAAFWLAGPAATEGCRLCWMASKQWLEDAFPDIPNLDLLTSAFVVAFMGIFTYEVIGAKKSEFLTMPIETGHSP